MRILAIRGENIASLKRFEVDFTAEPLRSAGIYAITGPTGSGKSSLLDALCLALFVRAPRLDGVSAQSGELHSSLGTLKFNSPANLVRRGCSTCHAEVDFAGVDGGIYRARWGYRSAKKKGAAPQEEFSLIDLEHQQVLISGSRIREYLEAVQRKLGWSYEQFTRAMLLAQGRFAEFLKAEDDVRADLLEKLTGTHIYSRISAQIFQRAKDENQTLADLQQKLRGQEPMDASTRAELEKRSQEAERLLVELSATQATWLEQERWSCQLTESLEALQKLEIQRADCRSKGEAARNSESLCRLALDKAQQEWDQLEPLLREAQLLDQQLNDQQRTVQIAVEAEKSLRDKYLQLENDQTRSQARLQEAQQQLLEVQQWLETHDLHVRRMENWDWVRQMLNDYAAQQQQEQQLNLKVHNLQNSVIQTTLAAREQQKIAQQQNDLCAGKKPAELESQYQQAYAAWEKWQETLKFEILKRRLKNEQHKKDVLQDRIQKAQSTQIAAQASETTARQILDLAKQARSVNSETLRAGLTDGQPCPVCGALEHPYTHEQQMLHDLWEGQERVWKETRAALEQAQSEKSSAQALYNNQQDLIHDLQKQLATMPAPDDTSQISMQTISDTEWETWSREQSRIRHAEWKRLEETLAASHKAVQAQLEAETALARNEKEQAALNAALALQRDSQKKTSELTSRIHTYFSAEWEEELRENSQAFIEKMHEQHRYTLYNKQKKEQTHQEIQNLEVHLQSLEKQRKDRKNELEQAVFQTQQQHEILQKHSEKRQNIFAGEPWEKAQQQAQRKMEEATLQHTEARNQLHSQREQYRELEGSIKVRQEQYQASRSQLENLSVPGLSPLNIIPEQEWTTHIRKYLRTLHLNLENHRNQLAEIRTLLDTDNARLKSQTQLRKELALQETCAAHWTRLRDLIGSQDGKAFRRIAQRFTLEQLLDHANQQLAGITSRYKLEVIPGSMHFCVVDAESYGEKRPVHTLSGGETFIVSLALALGLAQMAAGNLTVESLFIDEGFGTLDSDALREVMTALAGLQAQGRKVGLITHVEEMKHQIPARIELIRQGQGTSSVRVVG